MLTGLAFPRIQYADAMVALLAPLLGVVAHDADKTTRKKVCASLILSAGTAHAIPAACVSAKDSVRCLHRLRECQPCYSGLFSQHGASAPSPQVRETAFEELREVQGVPWAALAERCFELAADKTIATPNRSELYAIRKDWQALQVCGSTDPHCPPLCVAQIAVLRYAVGDKV